MDRARITVNRQSPEDIRDRQVIVSVDGRQIGVLMFGQSVTEELEPGPHRLRIHNTLMWKTLDLELEAGEHARFTAVNRAGPGTYALLGMLGAGPIYLAVRREP